VKTNKVELATSLREHSSDKKNIKRYSGFDGKVCYKRSEILTIFLFNFFRFRSRNEMSSEETRRETSRIGEESSGCREGIIIIK
jgi:hypothetical protein